MELIKKLVKWVFLLVLLLSLFTPFVPLLLWSFTKQWPWPQLFPQSFHTESWTYLFSKSGMAVEGLQHSLTVAFITLVITSLLGIPAANVLADRGFVGKGFVFVLFLSPLFIPFTVSIMGLHQFSIYVYFLPKIISVSIAHVIITFPYFFVLVWFQYRLLGRELQEAAYSLRARRWQIFLWIELPQLWPAIYLASLLVVIVSFSQYVPTWIMSGGTLLTLPLIIFPFASSGDSSIVAAYSLWLFMPIILFVVIYFILIRRSQRRLERDAS